MKKQLTLILPIIAFATAAHAASDTYIRNGNIYTNQNSWIVEVGGAGASDLFKAQHKNATPLFNFGYHSEDFNVDFGSLNYRFFGGNDDLVNLSAYLGSSGLYQQTSSVQAVSSSKNGLSTHSKFPLLGSRQINT